MDNKPITLDPLLGGATDYAGSYAEFQALVAKRKDALRERLGEIIPNFTPSVLEIGSGHGHFLVSYAAAHPELRCIGIDIITDRIRRANKKKERANLGNVEFLCCEGGEFLDCLPVGVRFDQFFVLFPDPWPKKRHHKNRLLAPSFLDALAGRSLPGARFFFRTDHLPYFEEVRETLEQHSRWVLRGGLEWPYEQQTVFQQRAESYFSLIAECQEVD